MGYIEHGGSWRPFWIVTAVLAVFVVLDVAMPGGDVPPLYWAVATIAVPGIVAAGTLSARRLWTVRVDARGLTVGREAVAFADIDRDHLAGVERGVDAGAPVLGGGWSLPKGRTGLPLRLKDGRTVLAPTRDPGALHQALVAGLGETPHRRSGPQGTLDR